MQKMDSCCTNLGKDEEVLVAFLSGVNQVVTGSFWQIDLILLSGVPRLPLPCNGQLFDPGGPWQPVQSCPGGSHPSKGLMFDKSWLCRITTSSLILDSGEVRDTLLQLLAWFVSNPWNIILITISGAPERCSDGLGGLCSHGEEQKVGFVAEEFLLNFYFAGVLTCKSTNSPTTVLAGTEEDEA